MEGKKFFNILKRHKYTLVAVPILVMATAYMLVRKLPNVYPAKASIAAGISDGSQQGITTSLDKNFLQEDKINQEFSNMIQMMQLKKVYDQVSYQLILHDMTNSVPFRKPSKLLQELPENAKQHAISVYTEKYSKREPLSLWDKDQEGLYKVLASMSYDYESLNKKLRIYRVENSDFINVEYESDSPKLSAFVVNTLCSEFIEYYSGMTNETGKRTLDFLGSLLNAKKDSLDTLVNGLKNFKITHQVLNLNDQAAALLRQKQEYEAELQNQKKQVDANTGALRDIDTKFAPDKQDYQEATSAVMNQEIQKLRDRIAQLYGSYIKNNDRSLLPKIDSLKNALNDKINQNSDKFVVNKQATRDNLIAQKMNLEVNRELARSSVRSLEDAIAKMNEKYNTLVPDQAIIATYENSINIASQEYVELLKKYNQAKMSFNSSSKVKQIEFGMPGAAQPSKKLLLVIISGLGSFIFCLLVLFVIFYIDDSINSPQELANKTNLLVLGYLPVLNNVSLLNLNHLWRHDNETPESKAFKTQLRSIRFETDNELSGSHILGVTSLSEGEGKTFLAMSLASAHLMINKKVLVIDGNFTNPAITTLAQPDNFLEDYLTGKTYMPYPGYENDITVLGNRGSDTSLFEIAPENEVKQKIEALRTVYDIILIECSSLDTLNLSKEWINIADKVMAVYEAGKSISTPEKSQVAFLQELNGKFVGWVLNKMTRQYIGRKAATRKKARG